MPVFDQPRVDYLLSVKRDAADWPHVVCTFHGESATHTIVSGPRNTQRATSVPQVVLRPGEQTCLTARLPVLSGVSWGQQHRPIRIVVRLEADHAVHRRGWTRLMRWLRSLRP